MTRIAYLAQPIDQAYDSTIWGGDIHRATQFLCAAGYHTYLPAKAWATCPSAGMDPRIQEVNTHALASADLLVAYLPKGVPSIGVPIEIAQTLQRGTPAIVITQTESFVLQRPGVFIIDRVGQLPKVLTKVSDWVQAERILAASRTKVAVDQPWAVRMVLAEGAAPPIRAYSDDAGLDLMTAREYTIEPGQFVDAHTQVDAIQLPDGNWGMITGRSSTLRKLKLHVPVAVIDPGYRGPLFVGVWNLSNTPVTIKPGDRLGQLILMPNNPAPVEIVEKVEDAPRGTAGFGSTGV